MGCSPSGTGCSSVGPPQGHKPCQQTCSSMVSSLHGPQVLAGACSSTGSPQGHSLLQASTCSSVGSSTGCRWRSAPPWTTMGCRGTACLTMVCSTGCRGKSLLWCLEHLLPLLQWPWCLQGCLPHIFFILSPATVPILQFFSFLNYVIPEALPSLTGSALASSRSVSEPAGVGSIGHGGSFWQLLTEAAPVVPHSQNLPTQTQYTSIMKAEDPWQHRVLWTICSLICETAHNRRHLYIQFCLSFTKKVWNINLFLPPSPFLLK